MNRRYNWAEYYTYWDNFVQNWFDNHAQPWDEDVSQAFFDATIVDRETKATMQAFDFDEMPDPYLGVPHEGVEAVFININPGGSQRGVTGTNLEKSKYYSLRGNGAWLLDAFEKDYRKRYSEYLSDFSCLSQKAKDSIGKDKEICGASWWFGANGNAGRLAWLNRIYGHSIDPCRVFALECCPFHSRKAGFHVSDLLDAGVSAAWFKDHVIIPSVEAARESSLPFVVGIGAFVRDLLKKLGYKSTHMWNKNSGLANWPRNSDNKLKSRTYSVFDVEGVNFLLTWAQTPNGGNPAPSEAFNAEVERPVIWNALGY